MGRALVLAAVVLAVAPLLASGRALTAHDLAALRRVGAPTSNGVDSFVVPVSVWDEASNKRTSNLWLGSTATGATAPVALSPLEGASDNTPVWTPDGKTVLFLSSRKGSGAASIWAVRADKPSDEPYEVASFPVAIGDLKLSPGGELLAFSALVYPGATLQETAERDAANAKARAKVRIFDALYVRRWDTWMEGKFNHVFYVKMAHDEATDTWSASIDTAEDLMGKIEGDCPQNPEGSSAEFAWSADGTEIAYTTRFGRDVAWTDETHVYTVRITDKETNCLTCSLKGTNVNPLYSPDGSIIAFLRTNPPGSVDTVLTHIWLHDTASGKQTPLTADWDRGVDSMMWSADGSKIIASAGDAARSLVFEVDVATGAVTPLLSEHNHEGISWIKCADDSTKDCLVFSRSDLSNPTDVYATTSDGSYSQITKFNEDKLSGIDFAEVSEVKYEGANGDTVQAWFVKPLNFDSSKKYPFILYIHGGPASAWFDSWSYRWNPQVIAAQGYAVLSPNPHGSSTFGANFTLSNVNDWGGKPFDDLMIGVDLMVQQNKWIDSKRLGAMGASYGGYMINWINGHTEGKFKCLVCHDGVFDLANLFYTTDGLTLLESNFVGPAYDPAVKEYYTASSPATFVDKWSTPELVIHGGKDFRIADSTGISIFTALQRKGVPSKFIYFPEENHWVLNPNNSIFWHEQVLGWLASYLKK